MVDAGACERDSNGMAGGGVMDLETDHFLNFAATLIQKNVRGYQQRQRLAALVCALPQRNNLCSQRNCISKLHTRSSDCS